MQRTQGKSDLIDLIHDVPFNPGLWDDVVCRLIDAVGGESAVRTNLDIVSGAGSGVPSRQDPVTINEYFAHWSTRNPLQLPDDPLAYVRDWQPTILRDWEWMNRDELRSTPYFNEFLHPMGAEQCMFIRLGLEGTMISAVSIARPESRGAFEAQEIAVARRYQQHLIQAVRTAHRVKVSQEALDVLDSLLASTDESLLFLDRQRRVRHISAAAERRLLDSGLLRLVGGRLEAASPGDDEPLQKLIDAAITNNPAAGASVSISAGRERRRIELTAVPIGPRSLAALSSEPFVMLSAVEAPIVPVGPTRDVDLRMRFGFTSAEARVALAIADGASLREFSDRIGVSIHTVRAQLGAIFAKTGTRRQADLVRLLLDPPQRSI